MECVAAGRNPLKGILKANKVSRKEYEDEKHVDLVLVLLKEEPSTFISSRISICDVWKDQIQEDLSSNGMSNWRRYARNRSK